MNAILAAWNAADAVTAFEAMLACCGASRWATAMVAARPIPDAPALSATADTIWSQMQERDWLEAFACHPRIGDHKPIAYSATPSAGQAAIWSQQEQSSSATTAQQTLSDLADLNSQYEQLFGFIYIVCATGKSAEDMVSILRHRLRNNRTAEVREAAEQQRQITQIRLKKWLTE